MSSDRSSRSQEVCLSIGGSMNSDESSQSQELCLSIRMSTSSDKIAPIARFLLVDQGVNELS